MDLPLSSGHPAKPPNGQNQSTRGRATTCGSARSSKSRRCGWRSRPGFGCRTSAGNSTCGRTCYAAGAGSSRAATPWRARRSLPCGGCGGSSAGCAKSAISPKSLGDLLGWAAGRYQAIERLTGSHPVSRLFRTLGDSPSGYYRWQRRCETDRVRENRRLRRRIQAAHEEAKGCHVTPRIERELRRRRVSTSRKRVARLRRDLRLKAKDGNGCKVRTDSCHPDPVAPNRSERLFIAPAADRSWVGDITYLGTQKGWLYLAVEPHFGKVWCFGDVKSVRHSGAEFTDPAVDLRGEVSR